MSGGVGVAAICRLSLLLPLRQCVQDTQARVREKEEKCLSVVNHPSTSATTAPGVAVSAKRTLAITAASHVGHVRAENEDAFAYDPDGRVLVVCDGVGGLAKGGLASREAVRVIRESVLKGSGLEQALLAAHQALRRLSDSAPQGETVGSTAVAASFVASRFDLAWVGDSRAYLVPQRGPALCLTQDHSLLADRVRAGHLTAEQARTHAVRSLLTQCLGMADAPPRVDRAAGRLRPGEHLVLCSDGVWEACDAQTLADLARDPAAGERARNLVEGALALGSRDNATAIVVEDLAEAPVSGLLSRWFRRRRNAA